jgi:hypothetical protein
MANKYLLVPEDIYKGLLQTDPESISLDHEKRELEKTKRLTKRPISKKNILYNQELRRLLKFNKEIKEKPIRVQLSNGAQLITKKPSKTLSKSDQTPTFMVDENDDDLVFYDSSDKIPLEEDLTRRTSTASSEFSPNTLKKELNSSNSQYFNQSQFFNNPSTFQNQNITTPKTSKNKISLDNQTEPLKILHNYIMKNPKILV